MLHKRQISSSLDVSLPHQRDVLFKWLICITAQSTHDRRGTRVVWNEVTGQFQQVFVVFLYVPLASRPRYSSNGRATALFSLAGFACYTHGANLMLLVMRSMRPTKKETKLLVTLMTSNPSIRALQTGPAASSSSLSPVCSSSYNLSFPAFSLFRHAPSFYMSLSLLVFIERISLCHQSQTHRPVCVCRQRQPNQADTKDNAQVIKAVTRLCNSYIYA